MQKPSQRWIFFSGTCSATYWPRLQSGRKRISFSASERTTATAFDEVQTMSHSAFTAAEELM